MARIRKGWPAFDMNICKLEVEQWFAACQIDLRSFHDPRNSDSTQKLVAGTEVERAKRLVKAAIAFTSEEEHP